jgi:hypothetical protein
MNALIASATHAEDDADSGNHIFLGCNAWAHNTMDRQDLAVDVAAGMCAGAVSATWDMLIINHKICPSDGVTRKQTALVVSKYMEEHPETLNWRYSLLIATALMDAWPCEKTQ